MGEENFLENYYALAWWEIV